MRKLETFTSSATSAYRVGSIKPVVAQDEERADSLYPVNLTIFVGGTFSGATATVQVGPTESGPWADTTEGAFTENGAVTSPMAHSMYFRVNPSGGDSNTDLTLWAS